MSDTRKPSEPRKPATDDAPDNPSRRRLLGNMALAGAALTVAGCSTGSSPSDTTGATTAGADAKLDAALREALHNVVVIYCENRSFNNLFADFPGLAHPLSDVPPERFVQRDRDGSVLDTLPKIWRGMVPHKQSVDGKTYQIGEEAITGLPNAPWKLRTPDGEPLPHGLVTRDLVHRFYRNQRQINGGKNDGFVAWGDSGALVMGHYENNADNFHLWKLASEYTLCDNFFMGAFGCSFLNHQYLVAAQPPVYIDADESPAKHRIAILEGDDPKGTRLKLADNSPDSAMEGRPRFASQAALTPVDFHAVNTFGPPYAPSFNHDPADPTLANLQSPMIIPAQTHLTVGDTLSAKGVSWAWYSGGWQMALDGKGDHGISGDVFPASPNFQAHHQPFNYFRSLAPGTPARAEHLR